MAVEGAFAERGDGAAPSVGASIGMNHCGVARKISLAWLRQLCG